MLYNKITIVILLPFYIQRFEFFSEIELYFTVNNKTSEFFTCPQTSHLEKVTCPKQEMYDSDDTDN